MTHHLDIFMSGENVGLNGLIKSLLCSYCLYIDPVQMSRCDTLDETE